MHRTWNCCSIRLTECASDEGGRVVEAISYEICKLRIWNRPIQNRVNLQGLVPVLQRLVQGGCLLFSELE